jgi:hypothetical protein
LGESRLALGDLIHILFVSIVIAQGRVDRRARFYTAFDTAARQCRRRARPCWGQAPAGDAEALLAAEKVDDAVVDLNLGGGGPRFEVARLLQQRGVPFVFVTSYDLRSFQLSLPASVGCKSRSCSAKSSKRWRHCRDDASVRFWRIPLI